MTLIVNEFAMLSAEDKKQVSALMTKGRSLIAAVSATDEGKPGQSHATPNGVTDDQDVGRAIANSASDLT